MNKEEKRKYGFYLEPHVYSVIKNDNLLMKDLLGNNFYSFSKDKEIVEFVNKLKENNNIFIFDIDKQSTGIRDFINLCRKNFIGDYLDITDSHEMPYNFYPEICIKEEMNRINGIKKTEQIEESEALRVMGPSLGRDIKNHLFNINIYLNSSCSQNCSFCSEAYKQIPLCSKYVGDNEISFEQIKVLLDPVGNRPVKVKLNGGNLFLNKDILPILEYMKMKTSFLVSCSLHYMNFLQVEDKLSLLGDKLSLLGDNIVLRLLLPLLKFDQELFDLIYTKCKNLSCRVIYEIIITDENDFTLYNELLQKLDGEEVRMLPLYISGNSFFMDNMATTKEMIHERQFQRRFLDQNQTINLNYWGNVTVDPSGNMYTSFLTPSKFNFQEHTLYDLVYNEITEQQGDWFLTRNNAENCSDCVYANFCSPISNYEKAIKRNNICTLNITE